MGMGKRALGMAGGAIALVAVALLMAGCNVVPETLGQPTDGAGNALLARAKSVSSCVTYNAELTEICSESRCPMTASNVASTLTIQCENRVGTVSVSNMLPPSLIVIVRVCPTSDPHSPCWPVTPTIGAIAQ